MHKRRKNIKQIYSEPSVVVKYDDIDIQSHFDTLKHYIE